MNRIAYIQWVELSVECVSVILLFGHAVQAKSMLVNQFVVVELECVQAFGFAFELRYTKKKKNKSRDLNDNESVTGLYVLLLWSSDEAICFLDPIAVSGLRSLSLFVLKLKKN